MRTVVPVRRVEVGPRPSAGTVPSEVQPTVRRRPSVRIVGPPGASASFLVVPTSPRPCVHGFGVGGVSDHVGGSARR